MRNNTDARHVKGAEIDDNPRYTTTTDKMQELDVCRRTAFL